VTRASSFSHLALHSLQSYVSFLPPLASALLPLHFVASAIFVPGHSCPDRSLEGSLQLPSTTIAAVTSATTLLLFCLSHLCSSGFTGDKSEVGRREKLSLGLVLQ
jgi:hypothetical protein